MCGRWCWGSITWTIHPHTHPYIKLTLCGCRRESADVWKLVLGINNLDHPSAHTQTRSVKSVTVHSRYNRAVVDYDISIIELDEDVHISSHVRPVCLPEPGHTLTPDTYCYITGWGHMGNRSESHTHTVMLTHTLSHTRVCTHRTHKHSLPLCLSFPHHLSNSLSLSLPLPPICLFLSLLLFLSPSLSLSAL